MGADGMATKAISGGALNSVALKGDGTVWAWGRNIGGESGSNFINTAVITNATLMNAGLTNGLAVAAGGWDSSYEAHTLVLKSDGTVAASGYNSYGQLGDGTTATRTSFVNVTNLTNIVAIAAGGYHSMALKGDGTVWSWGYNAYGELGIYTNANVSAKATPGRITNLVNVVALAAGEFHSLALKADGTVWAWGYNNDFQIGNSNKATSVYSPVQVTNLANIVAIAAGGSLSMALKADGTVWVWGDNSHGQAGNGYKSTSQPIPIMVTNLSQVVAIATGGYHALALRADGTVLGWGMNAAGQVNYGASGADVLIPSPLIKSLPGVISVAAGEYHSLVLMNDGTVQAFGSDTYGQSGVVQTAHYNSELNYLAMAITLPQLNKNVFGGQLTTSQLNPQYLDKSVITGSANIYPQVVAGLSRVGLLVNQHTMMAKTDGSVWSFGYNVYGQIGDGSSVNRALPTDVNSVRNIVSTYAGGAHSVVVKNDGTVWAWGQNEMGQVGDGTTINRSMPVMVTNLSGVLSLAAGERHSLALKTTGQVYGWGANDRGQLGDGLTNNTAVPVAVTGLTNISSISAGVVHSLALRQDGTVWGWGGNLYGQVGDGTVTNRYVPVQATNLTGVGAICCGDNFSLALKTNGTVWAWGNGQMGQLGAGVRTNGYIPAAIPNLTNVVSVKAGSKHALALVSNGTVWAWGRNFQGQLGQGNTNDSLVPVQVMALSGIIAIAANGDDSYAILTNGTVLAWGNNDAGQLGFGSGGSQSLPVNVSDFWLSQPQYVPNLASPFAQTGRFTRGNGSDPTFQSFVIPLNYQAGVVLANEGMVTNIYPNPAQAPWFLRSSKIQRWHYSALGDLGFSSYFVTNGDVYFPFDNAIVAFGSQGGGSLLPVNQPTTFGAYAGARNETNDLPEDIVIKVYRAADFAAGQTNVTNFASIDIPIPRQGDSNGWSQFVANGFVETVQAYGLRTDLRLVEGEANGLPPFGVQLGYHSPFTLTHTASSTEYYYQVEASGLIQSTNWMVLGENTNYNRSWSILYTMDFAEPLPWQVSTITTPSFTGQPVPPSYWGKSPLEITNLMAQVTNQFNLTSYTNVNLSPDLRSNPTLDNFVAEMNNDPIALANYVYNQIALCDALGFPESGATYSSVNAGGVDRSALETFMEGEGSPVEQCSLLVYLLRKAGYPAAYVYPTNNNVQLLDTSLSKLLQFQVHGALNYFGQPYTTNSLITVNYPWVVTQIGTNCVHLFPWIKDTEITEGLNLYDYMPTNYNSGYRWVTNYCYGDPNILSLDPESNVPRVLFPDFIKQTLKQNYPGISVSDIGLNVLNRPNYYSRWQDFPTPNVVNNVQQTVLLDNLASSAITNVSPAMTNIFNLVSVEVDSISSTNKLRTGEMRVADVLNRRFLFFTNGNNMVNLWLDSYGSASNGLCQFTNDKTLLNTQLVQYQLAPTESNFNITMTFDRHRSLGSYTGQTPVAYGGYGTNYLGIVELLHQEVTNRPLARADVAAICFEVGGVSQATVDTYVQDYWQVEQKIATNTSANAQTNIPVQNYKGTAAYLIGMSYYKNCTSFAQQNARLHKQIPISELGAGLAKLKSKALTEPSVDMCFYSTINTGDNSANPAAGNNWDQANSYNILDICNRSAEEHMVINSFFNNTNAISTVRLLQMAQGLADRWHEGIVQLNWTNYQSLGAEPSLGYGDFILDYYITQWSGAEFGANIELQNFDPSLWSQVTNNFKGSNAVWNTTLITPGYMLNGGSNYMGMAAFIMTPGYYAALISQNELDFPNIVVTSPYNGGWGDETSLFAPINSGGELASLSGGDDTPLSFDSWPTVTSQFLPDTISLPDAPMIGSAFSATPFQTTDFNWSDNLFSYQGPSGFSVFDLIESLGNPGEVSWWNQWGGTVSDPVDPVTGAFHIDATDLSLPGPMPLEIRRNYSSQNLSSINGYGYGWKLAYLPYLTVTTNKTSSQTNLLIYAAEMDGSVLAYRQQTANTNLYLPMPQDNPTLNNNNGAGIGSTGNLFHNQLVRYPGATNQMYKLFGVDGSVRTFTTNSYPLVGATNTISRLRPYITSWTDNRGNSYSFQFGTNSAGMDYGQVNRVSSSNGNFIELVYNPMGFITEAFTEDGRFVQYAYDNYGDLVQVTLPDATQINYVYEHYTFVTNGATVTDSDHLILQELKPDGRELDNAYDTQRREVSQMGTVGVDLNTYTNAVFTYANNFVLTNSVTNLISGYTLLTDVNNNNVRYNYTNSLITLITDQLGRTNTQVWYTNTNAPGYYQRSLFQSIDKRGLVTQYMYDTNGNATNVTLIGDLTGNGITTQQATNVFSYNTNNLLWQVVDAASNKVVVTYDTNYQFLPDLVAFYSGNTPVSTNQMTYGQVVQMVTNGVTVYTNAAYGVLQQMVRAYGAPEATTNVWTYNGQGFPVQKVSYTGTSDPNVTNYYVYTGRGELLLKTDAAGRSIQYTYDGMSRVTAKEVFDTGAALPMYQEYNYYDDNGEVNWWQGPRNNPNDYITYDYDGDGRKIQETHWRSEAAANGTGVVAPTDGTLYATTFHQYDKYGDLVQTTDPYGNNTWMVYDAAGQMIQKQSYAPNSITAMAVESYAYEPGGQVRFVTNALGGVASKYYTFTGKPERQTNFDGSTQQWTYYSDGRPNCEYLPNGNYFQTTYDDVNRLVKRTYSGDSTYLETRAYDRRGNLIAYTNAVGAVATTVYDGLNRVKQATVQSFSPTVASQTTTYTYDAAGKRLVMTDGLTNSVTISYDPIGRVLTNVVADPHGNPVSINTTAYSADYNSVTTTAGSGAGAISTTVFTDTYGKPVLTQRFPTNGVINYTINTYDVLENQVASQDELGQVTTNTYDALDRLETQTLPDGATTTFGYNAAGSLTNRVMPGGLTWSANYDPAGRITTEQLAGGGLVNRQYAYQYYASGPAIGQLQSKTDLGRALTNTVTYDSYLRVATNAYGTNSLVAPLTLNYQYDQRGLVTNLLQISPAATNTVLRTYDGFGQLAEEKVLLSGTVQSDFTLTWDATGRRLQLAEAGAGTNGSISYAYQADGRLTNVLQGGQNYAFSYGNNGLLQSRANPWRSVSVNRDGQGRPLQSVATIGGGSALAETLTWRADSTLNSYTATRTGVGAWDDSRVFQYDARGHLTSEPLGISTSVAATNAYVFDSAKLGVLTSAQWSGGLTNQWQGSLNGLAQVAMEAASGNSVKLQASGRATNATRVTVSVDGLSDLDVVLTNSLWSADVIAGPGTHTLAATASYPVGTSNTITATRAFSVVATNGVTDQYDAAGNLTNRVYASGKTQSLTWDALNRLAGLVQRDGAGNGFNWTAYYDGQDRRLRTVNVPVATNIVNSSQSQTNDSYYDPQAEFLELAVAVNGQRAWKVMGPDLDGNYGGLNGVGGLEATLSETGGATTPVLNDYWGNVPATITGTQADWSSLRVGGYGPVGGVAPQVSAATPLAQSLLWRSRRMDPSGYFYMGARYYDPVAGHFVSPDPLGQASSMDLYSAFNGDPINHFDADGRFAAGSLNGAEQYGDSLYTSLGNGLDAALHVFSSSYQFANKNGQYQEDGRYEFNVMNGSDAYQAGNSVGYAAAEIGLQVGLVVATEGLGELAPAEEAWASEGGAMRMGGTMELKGVGEAADVVAEGAAEGAEGAAGGAAKVEAGEQLEFGFAKDLDTAASEAPAAENYFTESGQGEFGFAKNMDSASGSGQLGANLTGEAEQLELNLSGASEPKQLEFELDGPTLAQRNANHQSVVDDIAGQLTDQGYIVKGNGGRFYDSTGQKYNQADLLAVRPNGTPVVFEIKTGDAAMSNKQKLIYPQIMSGEAIPSSPVANFLKIKPGIPLNQQGFPKGIQVFQISAPGL